MTPSTANTQETMARVRQRLAAYYRRHEIDIWLRSPQKLLGGRRACDLINAGDGIEVERLLDQLDSGAYL
jgi:uncharacterized protein (DUF2384 family)